MSATMEHSPCSPEAAQRRIDAMVGDGKSIDWSELTYSEIQAAVCGDEKDRISGVEVRVNRSGQYAKNLATWFEVDENRIREIGEAYRKMLKPMEPRESFGKKVTQ